jgi:hypothetical protein
MSREDKSGGGAPLLTPEEWRSLKSICDGKSDPNKSEPAKI